MKDFVFKIDYNIAKLFHQLYLWGGDVVTNIMKVISHLAEAGILFLMVGLTLALFKRTRKIGITILFAVAIGFLFTNIILKNMIARSRPFETIGNDYYKWWLSADAIHESGYSFPSGHTTAMTAFAIAIFLTINKKYSWYALFFPILMASSRIYLMVHYFSDCVGGIVVGTVSALLALLIVTLIYKSKWKFFVWVRELEIFKSPKAKSPSSVSQTEKVAPKTEDYVYETQAEEKQSQKNISLIQQDIQNTAENDTKND